MELPRFKWFGLNGLALSWKLFVSLQLLVLAFCYLTLLGSIWKDTQMSISNIAEGYGSMESLELIHHSFQYLFWFAGIFTISGALFLLSSYSERFKRTFAVVTPVLILVDIAATWCIPLNEKFAWVLFGSGLLLAVTFASMFFLIQWDLWRPSVSRRNGF